MVDKTIMENQNVKPLSDGATHGIALEATKIIFAVYNKDHDIAKETPESIALALAEMYCRARRALPSVLDVSDPQS